MVVSMTVDPARADEVDRHLREDVRPWAERQEGFVSGQWLRLDDGEQALGIVTFDTVEHARAAARGPGSQRAVPGRAWNTDSVQVFGLVANA